VPTEPLGQVTHSGVILILEQSVSTRESYQALKNALVNAPVLAMPIDGGVYALDTTLTTIRWVACCNKCKAMNSESSVTQAKLSPMQNSNIVLLEGNRLH